MKDLETFNEGDKKIKMDKNNEEVNKRKNFKEPVQSHSKSANKRSVDKKQDRTKCKESFFNFYIANRRVVNKTYG